MIPKTTTHQNTRRHGTRRPKVSTRAPNAFKVHSHEKKTKHLSNRKDDSNVNKPNTFQTWGRTGKHVPEFRPVCNYNHVPFRDRASQHCAKPVHKQGVAMQSHADEDVEPCDDRHTMNRCLFFFLEISDTNVFPCWKVLYLAIPEPPPYEHCIGIVSCQCAGPGLNPKSFRTADRTDVAPQSALRFGGRFTTVGAPCEPCLSCVHRRLGG